MVKFSDNDVKNICNLYKDGLSLSKISKKLNIGKTPNRFNGETSKKQLKKL